MSLKFQQWDLGQRRSGELVEVQIKGNAANVRLMDSANLQKFRKGQQHRYYGGLVKRSPWRVKIPRSGHWYVTVDLGGLKGHVSASVSVLPGALPQARNLPLSSAPSLIHQVDGAFADDEVYDVFISHASEDKEEVVRPLANALRKAGLKVWYDEFELHIGDSLRRKIDQGLAKSRFGIVVISPDFIRKGWTNYELDGLITRAVTGDQILLPIWHHISKKEVIEFSPSLADRLARNTATDTVEDIASEISQMILGA